MKNGSTQTEFSNGYRFVDGQAVNAILDPNGKLSLRDGGSLTVYQSWKDYVREVMCDTPTKGDEDSVLEQLSVVLGEAVPINVQVSNKERPKEQGDENDMKNATAAPAKAATKKAAPAPKTPKADRVQNPCICGCGGMTFSNFVPGHDSRVHSWQKKVAKGEIKLNSLPASAQKYIKEHSK